MPTIGLCMIVKNEAPVIRHCLTSVRPIIDHWVIVDTGSTDGTQDIIRAHLKDVPGELHERPWQDFATNRSDALVLARAHADYSLIIDADDTLDIAEGFRLPELTGDAYTIDIHDTAVRYRRLQLVRNALPWRYRGVLHEFLTCEGAGPTGHLPIVMRRNHDGARRRNPETYRRDVAILERALSTETDPFLIARYTFYLAQSHRDCGDKAQAIEAYLRRAGLGYWDQEIFCSLYKAAQLKEELGHDPDEIVALYLRASAATPGRAEALHAASRLCRMHNRFAEGYDYARRGRGIPFPLDGLFVEQWVYDYGLLDEFAINAYWTERYQDCLEACQRLLRERKLPDDQRDRVERNANFAAERIWRGREVAPAAPGDRTGVPERERLRIVDVGGGDGLQAKWLPFVDRITPIFFEPNPAEVEKLRATIGGIPGALVIETGLANRSGTQTLNVTSSAGCSSLRQPNYGVLNQYRIGPAFHVIKTVPVECVRYDELYRQGKVPAPDAIKIDVQGFEHEVLQGFGGLLETCLGVELEAHLYELYHGQKLLHDLVRLLDGYGLVLRRLRPVPNFDGDIVEVDAFFTQRRDTWRGLGAVEKQKFALLSRVWGLTEYSDA